MSKANQNCVNCYNFLQTGSKGEGGVIGYCRCNPPVVNFNPETGRPTVALFPIVLGNSWCSFWDSQDEAKNPLSVANKKVATA